MDLTTVRRKSGVHLERPIISSKNAFPTQCKRHKFQPRPMPADTIKITGARQHNLKNISIEIPRNKLVVFSGMSGSGKSSLAFNTLYAEGQRPFTSRACPPTPGSFSTSWKSSDVDFIEGLSPAIAIEQRTSSPNPRSTIATATEIYDYLRILYSACGQPHDPETWRGHPSQNRS